MVLNNIKAFFLHIGLDVIVLFLLFLFSHVSSDPMSWPTVVQRLFGLLLVVLCICLGFLLTPQGSIYKNFLSCILPAIIGFLIWLYCYVNLPDSFTCGCDPSGWRLVYVLYINDSGWMVALLNNSGLGISLSSNANLEPIFSFIPSFLLFIGLKLKAKIAFSR